MEISKKQQFINECREAMEKDNAGVTMFIQMPTGEEELIHNPNLAAKLDYIERAYDDDLHLKSCPEIRINEYHIHIPQEEVMDFGVALMNLKEGRRVARKGWNGKGQYLELATANTLPSETKPLPLSVPAVCRWAGWLPRPICWPRTGLFCEEDAK